MFFLLVSEQGVFLHVIHAFFFFNFINMQLILQFDVVIIYPQNLDFFVCLFVRLEYVFGREYSKMLLLTLHQVEDVPWSMLSLVVTSCPVWRLHSNICNISLSVQQYTFWKAKAFQPALFLHLPNNVSSFNTKVIVYI